MTAIKNLLQGKAVAGRSTGGLHTDKPLMLSELMEALSIKKPITLISGTTINWDVSKNINAKVILTSNSTLNIIGVEPGDYGTIKVFQDAIGSRTLTLPATSIVMGTQGGSTLGLTNTANAMDITSFYYDGTNFTWNLSKY